MSIPKPLIRSSSLPLFMACNAALLNPDALPRIEQDNEMALAGTLVHALCEQYVKTGQADLDSLKLRLSPAEVDRAGRLFGNFLSAWKQAKKVMKFPRTEVFLEAELPLVKISGHLDVLSTGDKDAYLLDYKTGRQHEDHYHQMAAYAYLTWAARHRLTPYTVNASVIYLEDLSIHPYTFSAEDLKNWEAEVTAQMAPVRYTVGRKCANCPLNASCPAHSKFILGANAALGGDPSKGLAWENMAPEDRGRLVDQMYALERAIDRAKLGLRNLAKREGSVDLGAKYEMRIVDDGISFLDTRRALPVIQKHLPAGVINGIARLPMEEVLAAIAKRAAKGSKTKAREEALVELEKAGAVVRTHSTKMFRRPKGEKVLA